MDSVPSKRRWLAEREVQTGDQLKRQVFIDENVCSKKHDLRTLGENLFVTESSLRRIWTSFLFPRKYSPRITILNLLIRFIYRSSYSRLTHSLNLVRGTLMAYWMGTNKKYAILTLALVWNPKCELAAKGCTFGACLAAARLPGVPLASHCHATVLPTIQPPKTTHWC